jgi:hypothetical protein
MRKLSMANRHEWADVLAPYRDYPYFERAVREVEEVMPPFYRPIEPDDVRSLMILAWLRGAAWNAHDTN